MKRFSKYLFFLALLILLAALAGQIVFSFTETIFSFSSYLALLAGFSVISLTTVLIFLKGQTKEPQSQVMHTMVAIGFKFLLELVAALLWFVVAKKNSTPYIIIFFGLYLLLTLFTVVFIFKVLKNKPL